MKRDRLLLVALALMISASVSEGASFLVPSDEELVRRSAVVVSGVVQASQPRPDAMAGIVTVTTISIDAILKGDERRADIEVVEEGGFIGDRGVIVSSVPAFTTGERVLLFLDRAADGVYRTWGGQLGKFIFAKAADGQEILIRETERHPSLTFRESDWKPHVEPRRLARPFMQFVEDVGQGRTGAADYVISIINNSATGVLRPTGHVLPEVYSRGSDQSPASRWTRFDAGQSVVYTVSGGPTATQVSAAQFALKLWSFAAGSNINLVYGGTSNDPYTLDNKNTIVFNASNVPGGGVAVARWSFSGSHEKGGSTFATTIEGDVAIRPTASEWYYEQIVAHEIGHTLGFRHSEKPLLEGEPASGDAIMYSFATGLTELRPYDREAVNHLYGDGKGGSSPPPPPCTAPTITTQPQSATVTSGSSATLNVSATGGHSPYMYQWFRSGVAIAGASAQSYNTGALTQTTSFFARVSSACGAAAQSQIATITVNPVGPACPAGHLCFHNGRFRGSLSARDHRSGKSAVGEPVPANDLFGYFSTPALTGDPNNLEVFVKVLDGRAVTGTFWVFYGGLTDLEYTLTIIDTATGRAETYVKPAGESKGGFDTEAFSGAPYAPAATSCIGQQSGAVSQVSSGTCSQENGRLCLLNDRFSVRLTARDQRTGKTGAGAASRRSEGFGYFSIPSLTGQTENPEVFVKMIDARVINGFWIFFAGLTDLEYTVVVTDTTTGRTRSYTKPAGSPCGGFDTSAFE